MITPFPHINPCIRHYTLIIFCDNISQAAQRNACTAFDHYRNFDIKKYICKNSESLEECCGGIAVTII